jgi:hypothetical protein
MDELLATSSAILSQAGGRATIGVNSYNDVMGNPSPPAMGQSRSPGRLIAWLGLAIAVLGVAGYMVQLFVFRRTFEPWYVPILGTLGAGLLFWSILLQGVVWRKLLLFLVGMLVIFEWFFMLYISRLPPYTGPVTVGKPFPAFTTKLADGSKFTQQRFQGDKDTLLVFFRGRW